MLVNNLKAEQVSLVNPSVLILNVHTVRDLHLYIEIGETFGEIQSGNALTTFKILFLKQ